jgi:hypothetical protein
MALPNLVSSVPKTHHISVASVTCQKKQQVVTLKIVSIPICILKPNDTTILPIEATSSYHMDLFGTT